MKRELAVLLVIGLALVGMAGAANYMYEKSDVAGVGFKNSEMIVQTQPGLAGNKLVAKESGSGNYDAQFELEVNRDPLGAACPGENDTRICGDYIEFTKTIEAEYMPVSYQTGTYDQKWIQKLCVQNYYIGATVVEMYAQAEHLQANTEVKTRRDCGEMEDCEATAEARGCENCGDLSGALEANFNSNVIGVAHIGWLSKDVNTNCKGRHYEYGRSVEDMTGVFSIEKFIQLWGNATCGEVSVDWLPCI